VSDADRVRQPDGEHQVKPLGLFFDLCSRTGHPLAGCARDDDGSAFLLSEEEARRLCERDPVVRREFTRWSKMGRGRDTVWLLYRPDVRNESLLSSMIVKSANASAPSVHHLRFSSAKMRPFTRAPPRQPKPKA
jgi:hypothetical protein